MAVLKDARQESEMIEKYNQRLRQHEEERKPWESLAFDVADYIIPAYSNFLRDRETGDRRPGMYNKIPDPTATLNSKVLGAGMQSGLTSAARPWLSLGSFDPDITKRYRDYYDFCSKVAYRIFAYSNWYSVTTPSYIHDANMGTSLVFMERDPRYVVRFFMSPWGEFFLDCDATGKVIGTMRRIWLTASQMVERFGEDKVSPDIRARAKDSNNGGNTVYPVIHVVEQNRKGGNPVVNKPWRSLYYEERAKNILIISGYFNRPFAAKRWESVSNNPYGDSVGFQMVNSVKLLQDMSLSQAEGVHTNLKPPIVAPTSLKNKKVNKLPGGTTYHDFDPNLGKLQLGRLYDRDFDVSGPQVLKEDIREMLNAAYFKNLFLALQSRNMETATEVVKVEEEALLMLSPVTEGEFVDFLDPATDFVVEAAIDFGLLPDAPDELQGSAFNFEYTSRLAQAQKLVWTRPIETIAAFTANMAKLKPNVLDKLDADQAVDEMAELLGVPTSIIVKGEKLESIRQSNMQAKAMEARRQAGIQNIEMMKALGQAKVQGSVLEGFDPQGGAGTGIGVTA